MFFCCGWFLFGVSYYVIFQFTPHLLERSMDKNMVSKICVGMSTILLLIYFTSKFKVTAKTGTLNARTSQLIPGKKGKIFQHYIRHFAFFASKYF